jgi:hypothetical protein
MHDADIAASELDYFLSEAALLALKESATASIIREGYPPIYVMPDVAMIEALINLDSTQAPEVPFFTSGDGRTIYIIAFCDDECSDVCETWEQIYVTHR